MDKAPHYRVRYKEDAEGNSILEYSGDLQNLVDACADEARARREMGSVRQRGMGMRKMMSIDPIVLMQIAQENGLDYFDPGVFEIAKGRDFSRFRTADDKLYFKDRSRKTFIGG